MISAFFFYQIGIKIRNRQESESISRVGIVIVKIQTIPNRSKDTEPHQLLPYFAGRVI